MNKEWKSEKMVIMPAKGWLLTLRSRRLRRAELMCVHTTPYRDDAAGGHIVYENGALKRILNPEGYVTQSSSGTNAYSYYAKDHLGNNRVVFNATPTAFSTLQQEVHYYPFIIIRSGCRIQL